MKIQRTDDLEAEMRKVARGEIVAPADAASPSVASTETPIIDPEQWLFSALLDMVMAHCETSENKLDSFVGWPANENAMRLLAEAGFIEITSEHEGRIKAKPLPAASALTARVEAARNRGGHSTS